jgi:drug/metabolite transporter (DMT)-like permease
VNVTVLALGLVVVSAFAHAGWNVIAKRVGSGAVFLWLFDAVSTAVYAPIVAVFLLVVRPAIGPATLGFMAGSAVLHLVYFVLLVRGYRAGDMSLVYPLARGSGPLLATAGGMVLFAERPGAIALAGVVLIVAGAFLISGDPRALVRAGSLPAIGYALLTGVFIAGYTLWDRQAVAGLRVPPLVYQWGMDAIRLLLLTPVLPGRIELLRTTWREHRAGVIAVGVLSPLAFLLVLIALTFAPVYLVAPTRELGVLIAAVMSARLLAERDALRRLPAAALMVVGIALLALGM